MTRIKECLDRMGQTQKWLALTLGVRQPSVHDWITGKNKPTAANLQKLSALFHVSTDYLLGISTEEEYIESKSVCFEPSTPEEYRLLSGFRSLNEAGQQFILQTLDTAVASNIYRQSDLSLGKEAK